MFYRCTSVSFRWQCVLRACHRSKSIKSCDNATLVDSTGGMQRKAEQWPTDTNETGIQRTSSGGLTRTPFHKHIKYQMPGKKNDICAEIVYMRRAFNWQTLPLTHTLLSCSCSRSECVFVSVARKKQYHKTIE